MSVRQRVQDYRERMRAQGFRPVQVWVPDTRREGFDREAARQAARVAQADAQFDDQDFIEAITVSWDE
ncbi:Protein of unknown function [Ruaniaceae bacterium KH17]|nr:Protein of unknown function [Ruaniaceae bacterium KH17]